MRLSTPKLKFIAMPEVHSEPRDFFITPSPARSVALIASIGASIALMSYLKFWLINDRLVPIGFGLPLLLFVLFRDRKWLWPTVAVFAILLTVKVFYTLPAHDPNNLWRGKEWLALSMSLVDLLVIALAVHLLVGAIRRRVTALDQLSASNAELAAREEEIARQNEELQSQTEELERQTEELRVSNDELARREHMLEILLALSRSLTIELRAGEVMEKICQTMTELADGRGLAAAILRQRGDQIEVVCHSGFGQDGLKRESWPMKNSFAALILERGRTGYLQDAALRPELEFPQAKSGPPMRSVLAAPLRVAGKPSGSLQIYDTSPRNWSDEQIILIESLAAQTSISLEAAELFEQVSDQRKRLETVLQTIGVGVSICDANCEHITYNPAGAAILGVVPNSPISSASVHSRYQGYRAGKPVGRTENPLVRAATRGEEISGEERELLFPSGRRITVLSSAAPIRDNDGKIVGGVGAFTDITQLKQLQLELDARRRQAEEDSVRKSRFLAAVSHDIRTPANAIGLLAELLDRSGSTPALTDEIPQIATDLKSASLSLVNLVTDVLDLTRFDAGRIELSESEFPLAELMGDEARQFAHVAREKGLMLSADPPPESLRIRADRIKLGRVLSNLIANAIKFTERGGVNIDASRQSDGGGVQIRVRDTGPGVPPEHQKDIFDEYFQLKHPRHDHGGSGLGLAISRRLVEAMGGSICVESTNGDGSTFVVVLPASCVVTE